MCIELSYKYMIKYTEVSKKSIDFKIFSQEVYFGKYKK